VVAVLHRRSDHHRIALLRLSVPGVLERLRERPLSTPAGDDAARGEFCTLGWMPRAS
jgi:hypothetical protein